MKRLATLAILTLAVLTSLATVAVAQNEDFLGGKIRTGDTVSVPAGETVEGDLYIFGGDINVAGRVLGDLVVFGGQVDIGGDVEGDVFVGAGTLDVGGTIGGDLRVGAGQVRTPGSIGEDLLAGVGQLTVNGEVGEDVIFGAGTVSLSGTVDGDVLGESGTYTRSGTVGGTEDVTIDEQPPVERPNPFIRGLTRFASLLIVGMMILWLFRATFEHTVNHLTTAPGTAALWGLGFVVGLFVVPLAVTVVGILLAVLFGWLGLGLLVGLSLVTILVTWVLVGVVAFLVIAVLAPITAATWAAARVLPEDTPAYLAMAAGLAILVILGLIPVVNFLVGLAVTIMGGGSWMQLLRRRSEVALEPEKV